MNNLLFLGGYAIAFIVLMLPVEICNQLKPLRKRYYFLALLLMTVAYYLVIASFTGQWAKPLLWTLQEFLFLSGLLFMEEISNKIHTPHTPDKTKELSEKLRSLTQEIHEWREKVTTAQRTR